MANKPVQSVTFACGCRRFYTLTDLSYRFRQGTIKLVDGGDTAPHQHTSPDDCTDCRHQITRRTRMSAGALLASTALAGIASAPQRRGR